MIRQDRQLVNISSSSSSSNHRTLHSFRLSKQRDNVDQALRDIDKECGKPGMALVSVSQRLNSVGAGSFAKQLLSIDLG
jgi:hypothetical protein